MLTKPSNILRFRFPSFPALPKKPSKKYSTRSRRSCLINFKFKFSFSRSSGLSLHSQLRKHNGNNHMVRYNNRRNSRTKLLQRKREQTETKCSHYHLLGFHYSAYIQKKLAPNKKCNEKGASRKRINCEFKLRVNKV